MPFSYRSKTVDSIDYDLNEIPIVLQDYFEHWTFITPVNVYMYELS